MGQQSHALVRADAVDVGQVQQAEASILVMGVVPITRATKVMVTRLEGAAIMVPVMGP